MAQESSIIFISGGVRSGKSRFAERLAAELAGRTLSQVEQPQTPLQLHYIAAGQASDPEMKARIAKHKKGRRESGLGWKTWEQPIGLEYLSDKFNKRDIVLLDCLTTLLNNEFFHSDSKWDDCLFQAGIKLSITEGVEKVARNCSAFIIVSNEVFYDAMKDDELVFTYKKLLGELHQQIVSRSQKAFLVEAGIPLLFKGGE
jgi:adenosylcobinamide kinase / adenosylcobinamide-phosphate guanylyltransferase